MITEATRNYEFKAFFADFFILTTYLNMSEFLT